MKNNIKTTAAWGIIILFCWLFPIVMSVYLTIAFVWFFVNKMVTGNWEMKLNDQTYKF